MTTDALFKFENHQYTPTDRAVGPWDPGLLHGGATGGLFAYAVEQHLSDPAFQFARLTVDLFRPVPFAPLTTQTETLREGKRLQIIEARLLAGDKEVARARALALRTASVAVPDHAQPDTVAPPDPAHIPVTTLMGGPLPPSDQLPPGMHFALQAKMISGMKLRGEGAAWLRFALPIVAGTQTSPFVHVAALADFGNGLGQLYLDGKTGCINADITLHLYRYPRGQWVCLDARARMEEHGIGAVETQLHDAEGPIGRVTQALVTRTFGR
ncbi:MAG: thioesterase family protein [Pseudomonadota bacterium]|nr:thioesterase family protein [Pseudomonadota bacterium]